MDYKLKMLINDVHSNNEDAHAENPWLEGLKQLI